MLKFGNTFVNFGGTYLTGYGVTPVPPEPPVPSGGWENVFTTYSAGDARTNSNSVNEALYGYNYNNAYTYTYTNTTSHNIYNSDGTTAGKMAELTFENPENIKYILVHGEWSNHVVGGYWAGASDTFLNALKNVNNSNNFTFGLELGGKKIGMTSTGNGTAESNSISNYAGGSYRYYISKSNKLYVCNDVQCNFTESGFFKQSSNVYWNPTRYSLLMKPNRDNNQMEISCYFNSGYIPGYSYPEDQTTNTAMLTTTASFSSLDNPKIYFGCTYGGNHDGSTYWTYAAYITPNFGVSAYYGDDFNLEDFYKLTYLSYRDQ